MLRSIFIVLAVAMFAPSSTMGQFSNTGIAEKVDSIVMRHMASEKLVGVAIGIVRDGQIYLTRGYGVKRKGTDSPVDSLTNFLTCSITKLFTATAVMQLSEQGKIDINRKLVDYLPDFRMRDERYKDITILHLLTHSSGLHWDIALKHSPDDSSALRKLVYSMAQERLDFAPGSRFNPVETYSNAAYDILGYLVQRISGRPFSEYIEDSILSRVNMHNSAIGYLSIPETDRSAPYIEKGGVVAEGGMMSEQMEHSPSGNLNSCALDLCRWMVHILNVDADTSGFRGVLKQGTLHDMWTSRLVAPQQKNVSIGLGWWITNSTEFGKYYWHVGDNPGFSATLMVFPGQHFGITVLSNGMYAEQAIWNKIPFDILRVFSYDATR